MKVVIAGAGIAGLAVAWRLAQADVAVELVERGLAGRGATWASAGMLAPVAEFGDDDSPLRGVSPMPHGRDGPLLRRSWKTQAAAPLVSVPTVRSPSPERWRAPKRCKA